MEKYPYSTSITNVRKHIDYYHMDHYDGIHFIKALDERNNEKCIVMYAYKWTKANGKQLKEVGREYIDRNEISEDLYFTFLSGYKVMFGKKKYYGNIIEPTDNFNKTTDLWYPNVSCEHLFNANELESHFKSVVPYLSLSNLVEVNDPMDLLRKYKSNHMCEMLTKAGFPYLCKWEKGISRLTDSSKKKFIRWIMDNKGYIYTYHPIFKFIIMAMKNNENGEQCRKRCIMENDRKFLSQHGFDFSTEQVYELDRYLEKQGCDVIIYRDYLEMSQKLGRNIEDRGVLYPRNLIETHDNIQKTLDKRAKRKINKNLKIVSDMLQKYLKTYNGLTLVAPETQKQMVQWGNKLHNCVGSNGYDLKVAEGKCIIIGVLKDNKIVECCELVFKEKSMRTKIVQLRGDHNQDSEYHDSAKKLMDSFVKTFNPKTWIGEQVYAN